MREAGRIVASTLAMTISGARPGVRLKDLDEAAAEHIARLGAKPSFLDYHPRFAPVPYPGVLCLSVNDEIVHGIPGNRTLRDGDLLSIDCGAYVDGLHGDAAVTIGIGPIDAGATRLIAETERALLAGVSAARPGNRLGDISAAVEEVIRSGGYGTPTGYGGHGVGTAMHEDPHVANVGRAGRGLVLQVGLVIAIEPMLVESGRDSHRVLPDGWTVATTDGSRAAHFEHTVAVTADGPVILTTP